MKIQQIQRSPGREMMGEQYFNDLTLFFGLSVDYILFFIIYVYLVLVHLFICLFISFIFWFFKIFFTYLFIYFWGFFFQYFLWELERYNLSSVQNV